MYMKNNVANWFEIYVEDIDRAIGFYESLLEVKLSKLNSGDFDGIMYAFPMEEGTGSSGALVKWSERKPSSEGSIIYFDSQDCNIELARVEKNGGKIIQPKMPAGEYGFSCLIQDSEGNIVGFYSSK
jgi:uncharacterized protein